MSEKALYIGELHLVNDLVDGVYRVRCTEASRPSYDSEIGSGDEDMVRGMDHADIAFLEAELVQANANTLDLYAYISTASTIWESSKRTQVSICLGETLMLASAASCHTGSFETGRSLGKR